MVVSGAIAAAFALPGCAPAGYNAADYGTGAQPAANAVEATPTPGAELEPEAGAEGEEKTDDGTEKQKDTPELTDEELTKELRATKVKRMGTAVVDEGGWVLYRFDKDKSNPSKSNCEGTCAKIWPPALTDGDPELDGVSADDVGTVERADGTKQLTIDGWPVYRYVGDEKPGKWTGQNVSGTWFVINPDGSKNLTCMPKISKPVAPPKDDEGGEKGDEGGEKGDDTGGESGGSDYSY
jgi:predicted lipoprotein with Yx(FWY)xxD motif